MSEKEIELSETVKEMDNYIKESNYDGKSEAPLNMNATDLLKFRNELFKAQNYNKALIAGDKAHIQEMNEKVERIIEFRELLDQGNAANREMFITLQHVGAIFNKLFDDVSELAKGTDFVSAGDLTKLLNEGKKFDIDESVFEEEVQVITNVDTSFEG